MKNTYRLIWSLRAVENLKKIINYLKENWTEKEIKNFSIRLDSCLTIIEKRPKTFPSANTITHNVLVYKAFVFCR